jgi:hypothetical protein
MIEAIYDIVVDTNIKMEDLCAPAPVEKTGQTSCWQDTAGRLIDCEGTGEDGESQRGVAWPNPRFTDNGDGTVTDNMTGLIWLKNANRFKAQIWAEALNECNTLEDDGTELTDGSSAGDWRLPNIRELHSLIDYGNIEPALPSGHPFTGVQASNYWSSTTFRPAPHAAWSVGSNYGYVGGFSKTSVPYYVWPVRGGN